MNERINMSSALKTSIVGFLAEWSHLLWGLRWMITLAILLVVSDFWFGISDSRHNDVPVKPSTAVKRTVNKVIDYICYVLIGATLGKAIAEPYGIDPIVTAITIMVFCYGFEIDSIYKHICRLHDIEPKYDLWDFLLMAITFKFKKLGYELADIVQGIKNNRKNR